MALTPAPASDPLQDGESPTLPVFARQGDVPLLPATSASTRYTVAWQRRACQRMVVTGSPLACIRRASAAFEASSAFGRPMFCPRARCASRAAARRSRPSSSSSSAKLAIQPATIRPVALEVSIPSRNDLRTMSRSRSSRIVVMTSAALRPSRSIPTTTMASPGRA